MSVGRSCVLNNFSHKEDKVLSLGNFPSSVDIDNEDEDDGEHNMLMSFEQ